MLEPPLISCVRCGSLVAAGGSSHWLRADATKGYGVCSVCQKAIRMFDAGTVVEPGIEPLVDAINAIPGAQVIYSCEGHITTLFGASAMPRPFVIFKADQEVARAINCHVFQSWADPNVRAYWDMEARFRREDGNLQWSLHCTVQRGMLGFLPFPRWVTRRQINDEIAAFAARIRVVAKTNSGNSF